MIFFAERGVSLDFYAVESKEAFQSLKASASGLSDADAFERLESYGYNEITQKNKRTILNILVGQLKNFLIILLFGATVLSIFLGDTLEAVGMFSIIILTIGLGVVQEYRAERAIDALKKVAAPTARVVREGGEKRIPSREIVPGDILVLEAGDIIAADARLFEESDLLVDQSTLSGESVPAKKTASRLSGKVPVSDQLNMVFMGTVINYGTGKAVVTSTGMATEFGKIAQSLQDVQETKTPLQVQFDDMASKIGIAVLVLVGIVFLMGLLFNDSLSVSDMFMFSVSLAVAAVPSSLPAIVTIGLALGAGLMARNNMIIKKLPATESLGSVTIICTDKTGTLTKNQITAKILYFDGRAISVEGSGYDPGGRIVLGKSVRRKGFDNFLKIGLLCNNAKLVKGDSGWEIMGDPTEGALIVLARKWNIGENAVNDYSVLKHLPFDSDRKMMSVVFKKPEKRVAEAFVKGAPDIILGKCSRIFENGRIRKITQSDRRKILKVNEKMAGDALRVLALAHRELQMQKKFEIGGVEKDLVFYGLVGMIDPPREEVKDAIQSCAEAGIKVMMITGDHALTARAVAAKIGLYHDGEMILTGEEIERMSEGDLEKIIEDIRIIARALPIQKLRIVEALKKKGHVVAMTGDGVNDAPALKKADVGIAMGITGSDVAKEVSETILVDDNFANIVRAVGEGRNIYDKILKSARYLLSCNLGEIVAVFLAILMRLPLPLVPLQILLMNLLTDGLPALGLGSESAEEDVMKRSPRNPNERLFNKQMILMTLVFGFIMGLGTLMVFMLYLPVGLQYAQTAAFTTLVIFEMFAVVGSRSLHPFRKLNIFSNKWLFLGIASSVGIQVAVVYLPPLQALFHTVPLSLADWTRIVAVSSLGFFIMEIGKLVISKIEKNNNVNNNILAK